MLRIKGISRLKQPRLSNEILLNPKKQNLVGERSFLMLFLFFTRLIYIVVNIFGYIIIYPTEVINVSSAFFLGRKCYSIVKIISLHHALAKKNLKCKVSRRISTNVQHPISMYTNGRWEEKEKEELKQVRKPKHTYNYSFIIINLNVSSAFHDKRLSTTQSSVFKTKKF